MPIPLKCECGRSMKVKDELAGKTGKCPSCGRLLVIPDLEKDRDAEDEVLTYQEEDSPADEKPRPDRRNRYVSDREPERDPPRRSGPRLDRDVRDEESRPRRKKKSRSSGVAFEEGWFGSINSGVVGGLLMMIIAGVWLVVGLMFDYLFFYPIILFVIGFIALCKGLAGGE